jgi:hypothetical protein
MDVDIVSDLTDGTADFADTTIPANTGDTSAHGKDAVQPNEGPKPRTETQPKQVKEDAAAPKPTSLRDQISNALKGETDTPAAATQDGRARDPATGKFVEKAADAAPPGDTPPAAPSTAAAPAGIDPQVFASLPAETQAALARTMEDVNTRQQRFAALEPLEQIIGPRRDLWALNGATPAQAINQLLALSDFAGRDPGGFIRHIAKNSGVDLAQLVLDTEPEPEVDPVVAALQKQVAELQGHRETQTREQLQTKHNQTVDSVIEFASEKGEDGETLLRPHFAELGDGVLPFISMVKAQHPDWPNAQVLQQAYDQACWATPGVRSKLQAAADAAAQAARLREGTERAERAKAAGVSVRSGAPATPGAAPAAAGGSLRDTIRASIAAVS